jgi:hypothetical protein
VIVLSVMSTTISVISSCRFSLIRDRKELGV